MDMKGLGKKSLVLVCGLACLLAGCTASERGRTLAEERKTGQRTGASM